MRFAPLLGYVSGIFDQEQLFSVAQFNERAKLLKLTDFDPFIDLIDEMAQHKIDEINSATELNKDLCNVKARRIVQTVCQSALQTNAAHTAIKFANRKGDHNGLQITVVTLFGIGSLIYNYTTCAAAQEIESLEKDGQISIANISETRHRINNQARKLMLNSLKASVRNMEQRALDVESNTRQINAQTERIGQYFKALTNALMSGHETEAMRQIAPPPPISVTSEDFERVSTTSSQDRVPAEYGRATSPTNIAADYHLELAEMEFREREREEMVQ